MSKCPACGEVKFVGHGPLCSECFVAALQMIVDDLPPVNEVFTAEEVAAELGLPEVGE